MYRSIISNVKSIGKNKVIIIIMSLDMCYSNQRRVNNAKYRNWQKETALFYLHQMHVANFHLNWLCFKAYLKHLEQKIDKG